MNFDKFWKTGNSKIPFVCQPVTPAPLDWEGIEFFSHRGLDVLLWSRGVKVEIGAKVGPMIERFNHRCLAAARFQGLADCLQHSDAVVNSCPVLGEFVFAPIGH